MRDTTGRLDILAFGILERIVQRDPVASAVFRLLEPQIRDTLRVLDVPSVRTAVKQVAAQAKAESRQKVSPPRRKRKQIPAAVTVTGSDGRAEVVEAEWVS